MKRSAELGLVMQESVAIRSTPSRGMKRDDPFLAPLARASKKLFVELGLEMQVNVWIYVYAQ